MTPLPMVSAIGSIAYPPGITTHRKDAPGFDRMVLVKLEQVFRIGNAAAVDHCLTLVLAGRLEFGWLAKPIDSGEEAGIAEFCRDC